MGYEKDIERAIKSVVQVLIRRHRDREGDFFEGQNTVEYVVKYIRDELDWLVGTQVTRKIIAEEFGIASDRPLWGPPSQKTSSTDG